MADFSELQSKINFLEKENQYLKDLLDQAGISYKQDIQDLRKENYDPNQGACIIQKKQIAAEDANQFFRMFWGRTDIYSQRTIKKSTGEVNYYPQCYRFWKNGCPKYYGKSISCGMCDNPAFKELKKEALRG